MGANWMFACWVMKLELYLSSCTKTSSKGIKDLQVQAETGGEGIGSTLSGVGIGKDFPNRTPFVQELRPTIDRWDFKKPKSFCTAKETINCVKRKPIEWQRIIHSYTADRGYISRIYKELEKQSGLKQTTPIQIIGLRPK